MATRNISTKLAIEGEAAYRSALSSINSELKSVNSTLKLTKSEFASNANSMEAMRAKTEALKNVQEVQAQKVKTLQDALTNAQSAVTAYGNKSAELKTKIEENTKALEKLRASSEGTAEDEKRLVAENEALNRELTKNEDYLRAAEKGVNSWQIQLNNAKISLNEINKELADTENAMRMTGDGASKLGDDLEEAGDEGKDCASSMEELAAAIGAAGLTAAVHKATEALAECVKESMEFETAMAGVKRTVGGSDEFISELGESFEELSTTIPITAEELANIATTAGQLGIAQNSVEQFAAVMAQLATTTDLTADNAATMLSQFSNITGVTDFDRLGATVAELGDATATTASKVVDMSQGMAAAANIAGMSATDILAISASVGSLGIEAQAGSTAMSTLISTLYKATETGDGLEDFAKVANMSAEEFKTAWGEDAAGALNTFIQGLNDTERNGKSAIVILDELGITNVRQTKAILGLASAGDLLSNTIAQASNAWEENTALADKAGIMYGTTEAHMTMLSNSVTKLKNTIGSQLLPTMENTSGTLQKMVDGLADYITEHEAAVPLITALVGALATLITTFTTFVVGIKAARLAVVAFNLVLDTNPVFLAISAVAALAVGIGALASTINDDGVPSLDELTSALDDCRTAFDEAEQTFNENALSIEADAMVAEELVSRLEELESQGLKTNEQQNEYRTIVDALNERIPDLNASIDEQTGLISGGTQALRDQIQAWKDLAVEEAMTTKYKEELAAWGEAKASVYENQILLSDAVAEGTSLQEQYNSKVKEYCALGQQLIDLDNDTSLSRYEWIKQRDDIIARQTELDDQIRGITQQLNANKEGQENLNAAIAEGQAVVDEYEQTLELARRTLEEYTQGVSDAADGMSEAGSSSGQNYGDGMVEGLNGTKEDVEAAAEGIAASVNDAVQNTLDIHSPSQKAYKFGQDYDQGLINGLESKKADLQTTITNLLTPITTEAGKAGEAASAGFNESFQKVKTKTANTINSLKSTIKTSFSSCQSVCYSAGTSMIDELISGMNNRSSKLYSTMRSIVNKAIQEARNASDTHSPSRKTEAVANDWGEGLIVGLVKKTEAVKAAMNRLVSSSINIDDAKRAIADSLSSVNVQMPTVTASADSKVSTDLSGVEAKIEKLEDSIAKLAESFRNKKIILDSGAVVGELADGVDAELGTRREDYERRDVG